MYLVIYKNNYRENYNEPLSGFDAAYTYYLCYQINSQNTVPYHPRPLFQYKIH